MDFSLLDRLYFGSYCLQPCLRQLEVAAHLLEALHRAHAAIGPLREGLRSSRGLSASSPSSSQQDSNPPAPSDSSVVGGVDTTSSSELSAMMDRLVSVIQTEFQRFGDPAVQSSMQPTATLPVLRPIPQSQPSSYSGQLYTGMVLGAGSCVLAQSHRTNFVVHFS